MKARGEQGTGGILEHFTDERGDGVVVHRLAKLLVHDALREAVQRVLAYHHGGIANACGDGGDDRVARGIVQHAAQ